MAKLAASSRPFQFGDALSRRRAPISANPTGMIAWAIQTGRPNPIVRPPSRSTETSTRLPYRRTRQTATLIPPTTISIHARERAPASWAPAVNDNSSPRRAAIAAPRKVTQRARCCTQMIEPEIPPGYTVRTIASASGRSAMVSSAAIEMPFSKAWSPLKDVKGAALVPGSFVVSLRVGWPAALGIRPEALRRDRKPRAVPGSRAPAGTLSPRPHAIRRGFRRSRR